MPMKRVGEGRQRRRVHGVDVTLNGGLMAVRAGAVLKGSRGRMSAKQDGGPQSHTSVTSSRKKPMAPVLRWE